MTVLTSRVCFKNKISQHVQSDWHLVSPQRKLLLGQLPVLQVNHIMPWSNYLPSIVPVSILERRSQQRDGAQLFRWETICKAFWMFLIQRIRPDVHRNALNCLHDPDNHDGVITELEPDILECEWSQVGLRKHHYEQSYWRWWDSSWAIPNPERWCCESAALNMPENFENSAVATGLEKVSFHSNPKERQCQRMLKLPHNCTHLTP